MRIFLSLFLIALVAHAEPTARVSQWNGYDKFDFTVADRPALLVKPKTPAEGHPWIWRTEFFGHEPQGDIALLAAGWHVAYFKVSDMYGAPSSIELMAKFHDYAVREYGLSKRVVLEGFSRGGLYAVNFAAAHPDKTAALYLDAPVLDIRSWPGGKGKGKGDARCWKQALEIFNLTEETAKSCLREQKNAYKHEDQLLRVNEIARQRGYLKPAEDRAIIEAMLKVKPVTLRPEIGRAHV